MDVRGLLSKKGGNTMLGNRASIWGREEGVKVLRFAGEGEGFVESKPRKEFGGGFVFGEGDEEGLEKEVRLPSRIKLYCRLQVRVSNRRNSIKEEKRRSNG